MKIAFASGKGGTGKTTAAVNLARIFSQKRNVQYLDCDVEEPNGHLFLHPAIRHSVHSKVTIPRIDDAKCTHCGECARFCAFNALASLPNATLVFPGLCHSCGGCRLVCPEGAIFEIERNIGVIERGDAEGIDFVSGRLDVGEAMSSPLIRAVNGYVDETALAIIDSPPGTSCPVVSSLEKAEMLVLVAEPTPFGLNDLEIAVDMTRELSIPCGVVINKDEPPGNGLLEKWCAGQNIPIWGRIPSEMRIAQAYSKGLLVVDVFPDLAEIFRDLSQILLGEAEKCGK